MTPPSNDAATIRDVTKRADSEPSQEQRWPGSLTVGVLAGISILLWTLIAGGVYLLVRILL